MTQSVLQRKKRPSERIPLSYDFTKEIAQVINDAASTHAIVALDVNNADVSAGMIESPTLAGGVSKCILKAGTDGQKYRVFFTLTTVSNYVYEHSIVVEVSKNS